jgi:hypothetical protein
MVEIAVPTGCSPTLAIGGVVCRYSKHRVEHLVIAPFADARVLGLEPIYYLFESSFHSLFS